MNWLAAVDWSEDWTTDQPHWSCRCEGYTASEEFALRASPYDVCRVRNGCGSQLVRQHTRHQRVRWPWGLRNLRPMKRRS